MSDIKINELGFTPFNTYGEETLKGLIRTERKRLLSILDGKPALGELHPQEVNKFVLRRARDSVKSLNVVLNEFRCRFVRALTDKDVFVEIFDELIERALKKEDNKLLSKTKLYQNQGYYLIRLMVQSFLTANELLETDYYDRLENLKDVEETVEEISVISNDVSLLD